MTILLPEEVMFEIASYLNKRRTESMRDDVVICLQILRRLANQNDMLDELKNHAWIKAQRVILDHEKNIETSDMRIMYYIPILMERLQSRIYQNTNSFRDCVSTIRHFRRHTDTIINITGLYRNDYFYFIVDGCLIDRLRMIIPAA